MVVFAVQNLISDPPFSTLDLISCRNVLIYLGNELQKTDHAPVPFRPEPRGLSVFGFFREHRGVCRPVSAPVDIKWKIFRRKDSVVHRLTDYPPGPDRAARRTSAPGEEPNPVRWTSALYRENHPGRIRPAQRPHQQQLRHSLFPGANRQISGPARGRAQF